MKSLFVLMCCVASLAVNAAERPGEFCDPEVQRLVTVDMFAFGGTGYAGVTSEGETAFAALLKKKEPIRFILVAFDFGTPEARCYALVALRELSPQLFEKSLAVFRKSNPKKITVMHGCVGMDEEPSAVIGRIQGGDYADDFTAHEKG